MMQEKKRNPGRLLCLGVVAILVVATLSGCLYTYHDINFEPYPYRGPGFVLWLWPSRLSYQQDYIEGKIVDTSGAYWSFGWRADFDDSLKGAAYLLCDSVRISASGMLDTLACNRSTKLSYPDHNGGYWRCGRIQFSDFQYEQIKLQMVVRLVYDDERPTKRFLISWDGKRKKKHYTFYH